MTAEATIAPLRIANEAFMVAATIERCPRQMMLRELVMNALEAAALATDAPKQVRIDAIAIDGAPKLRIWNTGRGMSQGELLQISDLSSSLFKTVSLDGNFGMGAKAASLASNKHGLRYRSCRCGKVSQIVLGSRGGVYGRILQEQPGGERREAIDVTSSAAAAGEDLSHDWTEVTLFGNSPEQDTAADPYAGDPVMPRDWVAQTLGRRYMRLPPEVVLTIEPSASGAAAREIFAPPLAPWSFDRLEAVSAEDGVVIHYGYRAKDSPLWPPRVNVVGTGAVVYDGEIYALTDGRRWALEAPTYGFTFAAKQCTVVVELPHAFGARPEQYRQFLRFNDGDQHQVQFADFGDLVRRTMPAWLKRIIASLLPAESDYLAEIRDEMRHLLAELGIEDLLRAPQRPKPVEPAPASERPADPAANLPTSEARKPPPRVEAPSPPEIIIVENEADIVEKGLGGRSARYYPAARQVFVNARYTAFARMRAQLAEEFAPFADEETIGRLAKLTSEWTIVQRIARTLLHSIGKPKSGWTTDEIKMAQSPETMSLMVDDIDPLLVPARRRMAAQLGLEPEPTYQAGGLAADPMAQRAAGELADAEAQLQRAMAGYARRIGPFYRQVALIHMRQRNHEAARAWLEKGMAVDPEDPWCPHEYAGLMLADNDLDRAAEFAEKARSLATDNTVLFSRRPAEIEARRGNFAQAETMLAELAAQEPENPWPHFDLAALHLKQDKLDAAAAAADVAIERSPVPSSVFLMRRAEVDLRRGDPEAATRLLRRAQTIDPKDAWSSYHLARIAMAAGRHEDALAELDAALALRPPMEALLHRAQSEIEMQRGRRAAALAAADRAVNADRSDAWSWHNLAGILQDIGDLDRAAETAAQATRVARTPSVHFYRRQAGIEVLRGDRDAALKLLDQAHAVELNEPWTWYDIAEHRVAMGDLKGADEAAIAAEAAFSGGDKAHALRRRAQIAVSRNDVAAAGGFLREAMRIAPTDSLCRIEAANLLLAQGEVDAAADMAKEAVALSAAAPRPFLLKRAAAIEESRNNWRAAEAYLRQAIAADGDDPQTWTRLADLHVKAGDLDAARAAAEKAVSLASGGEARSEAPARAFGI